jgi:PHD/YefM family antitoxin component YafN of YafNO toxin-antitoxin module
LTHFTSREFNQSTSKAKKDSLSGPVFFTDRGKPSHVLLSYGEYERITSDSESIVQALSMPGLSDVDFNPRKAAIEANQVDLS